MKDIATRTGYSVNTVSRALRGDKRLPESTRISIQNAADEAGYIKNNFASTLRSGTSHLIAIVVNDICNPHYTYMISDIEHYLREMGYDILILWSSKEGDENQTGTRIIRLAVTQSVDGILYFPYQHDHESISFMNNSGIPFILVDRKVDAVGSDVIRCDDYSGGKLAAEHFLSLGHRRFLYVQGPAYSSSQTERQSGFVNTLREHGIPEEDIHLIPDEILQEPGGADCLLEKLKQDKITAALVFRDEMAYLMINLLYAKNFLVPRDVSVIGFDYLHGFSSYLPPLSSIFCAKDLSLGRTAAQLLLERIQDPEAPFREVVFPVVLYDGGTTREI